jgi:hypothetical protein
MKSILTLPPVVLQTIFGTLAVQLGRATKFIRRQRKLRADNFAMVFCLFLIRSPKFSLQSLAGELNISESALAQRLQEPVTAVFLRTLLLRAVGQLTLQTRTRTVIPLLKRFKSVVLVDGTTLALPDALIRRFPGCGGGTKKDDRTAAVKVLLRIDLITGQSTQLALAPGRTADVNMLGTLEPLAEGTLEIADLGFFDTDRFADHNRRDVWWLSRLPARISVRPKDPEQDPDEDPDWQELADWLKQLAKTGADHWEGTLEVAKSSPLSMRVLVTRCPHQEAARRRRKLRAQMKKKGKTAGWRQLVLCDWWVLATNIPAQKLTRSEASELYRTRWQIELVFKRWKSLGHVEVPEDLSANRAECELYGRLLGVLVVDWLALLRGGPLSGHSLWRAWQAVMDLLKDIIRALKGRINWKVVLSELADKFTAIPKPPQRTKQPSTRQRLLKT